MNKLKFSLLTTALVACGYSSVAIASNKFTQVAEQNPVQQAEQGFYEDSEGFDTAANFQGKGWGWNNANNQANLLECTTDCSTAVECTSSASTCTQQSSSTETLTMLDVEAAKDETSPFYTEEQSHIAWAIVEDFNKEFIG